MLSTTAVTSGLLLFIAIFVPTTLVGTTSLALADSSTSDIKNEVDVLRKFSNELREMADLTRALEFSLQKTNRVTGTVGGDEMTSAEKREAAWDMDYGWGGGRFGKRRDSLGLAGRFGRRTNKQ